jgi:hypothetical protein
MSHLTTFENEAAMTNPLLASRRWDIDIPIQEQFFDDRSIRSVQASDLLGSRLERTEQPIVSGARIATLEPVALGAGSPPTT